jgi:methyltransferase
MVALHTGLLAGAVAEVWVADRPFRPRLGWPMLGLAAGSQALRWWCIRTLGPQWNTRVIVVPGLPLVRRGPYRYLPHPNYVAVVVEGVALPLVHTAWVTALTFTGLNAFLLRVRLRVENRALTAAGDAVPAS